MSAHDDGPEGVRIGNVSGGIRGSVIAGRDVSNTSVSVGGKTMSSSDTPSREDLAQLFADLRRALGELSAHGEELSGISASAPFSVQGAEVSIKAAAKKVEGDVAPEDARSAQEDLTEAAGLIGTILEKANSIIDRAVDVGRAVKPLAERLEPLVEKLAVAALWIGRLWLGG